MRSVILYNLLLCILLTGCTNKQKQPTIIGGASGTTEITIADTDTQQYDIDAPIPLSEIEQYNKRVTLKRIPNVTITHLDAYKIKTQKPVYTTKTNEIILDVINVDATTEWNNGKTGNGLNSHSSTILGLPEEAELCPKETHCRNISACQSLNIF